MAEVDTYEHVRAGVPWPMRSFERVVHPLAGLAAHDDWRVTGLDVDRSCAIAYVQGPQFAGAAAAPPRAR